MNQKIARFLADNEPETPCLVVDLDVVAAYFAMFRRALPLAQVYYAVKANPAPQILSLLNRLGSSFDAASIYEVEQCIAAGAAPGRISLGNTIKKRAHIARAHDLGVRLFAFDSAAELDKLAATGIRFERHMAQSSWTKTSMASLWTRWGRERFSRFRTSSADVPSASLQGDVPMWRWHSLARLQLESLRRSEAGAGDHLVQV